MVINFIKFQYYRFARFLVGQYSLILVKSHIKLTPTREDMEREMILEKLRYKQRTMERVRYNYWIKMCETAQKLGVDEMHLRSQEKLSVLETENILAEKHISQNN